VNLPERPDYDDRDYGLVMPFVCVASAGGPFDDDAFTAGYQMGLLDAKLNKPNLAATTEMIYEQLRGQADLLAMRYGLRMDVLHESDGWLHVGFAREAQ
jgi:hypothetical protein